MSSHVRTRNFLFTILVEGMFTTFVARLFTNTSDGFDEKHAMSCV
jgi:hypothetical protein